MPATDTHYDFDDGVLRELRAAQARLLSQPAVTATPGAGRHPSRLMLLAGASALGLAAAGGVVALGSHSPGGSPAAGVGGGEAPAKTGALLTAKLTASLGETSYMITSHVTQDVTGEKLTSWIDPATGNRRLLLADAAGASEIAEGIVVRGGRATITTLDYATRTATTETESARVIQSAARLGVNVPSPSDIRSQLRSATLVSEGQTDIDGHRTYRMRMTVPPRSELWFRGDNVQLYVDAASYQLVRITISHNGTLLDTDDLTWTPRSTADLTQTRLTIPAGFTKR